MSEGSPPKNTRRRETVVGAGTEVEAVRPRAVAAEAEADALGAAGDARLEEALEPVEARLLDEDEEEEEEEEDFRGFEADLRFLEAKGSVAPCAVGRFREKGSDISGVSRAAKVSITNRELQWKTNI